MNDPEMFDAHRNDQTTAKALEPQRRIKLHARCRAIQRTRWSGAEGSEDSVRTFRHNAGNGKCDARISGIAKDESVPTHVGLLRYVREIEGGQHSVLFDAEKGIAEQHVASFSGFAHLNFGPIAVALVIRKNQIGAVRAGGHHVMRLSVGDEIQKQVDGPAFAMFKFEASN